MPDTAGDEGNPPVKRHHALLPEDTLRCFASGYDVYIIHVRQPIFHLSSFIFSLPYAISTTPKNSGQWKFGSLRPMGDQLRKWVLSHLSPHL